MITTNEYINCSCGGWARIQRGEKGYRDRIICSKCGCITVYDGVHGQKLILTDENGNRLDSNSANSG